MYYVMMCMGSMDAPIASLTYNRDDSLRNWASGDRFSTNPNDPPYRQTPPEPIKVEIWDPGELREFCDNPVPLMTNRLLKVLQDGGVDNLDTYRAEIYDAEEDKTYHDHVAFNLVGAVSAADLGKSSFDAELEERMVSMDFDSLAVDEDAARGALMFRLAEAVNAILVHEKIKEQIEAAGINTLTFIPPDQWAG